MALSAASPASSAASREDSDDEPSSPSWNGDAPLGSEEPVGASSSEDEPTDESKLQAAPSPKQVRSAKRSSTADAAAAPAATPPAAAAVAERQALLQVPRVRPLKQLRAKSLRAALDSLIVGLKKCVAPTC